MGSIIHENRPHVTERTVSSDSFCSDSSTSCRSSQTNSTKCNGDASKIDEALLKEEEDFEGAFESCSLHVDEEYMTISPQDILTFHATIMARSVEESRKILQQAIIEHEGDPCLAHGKLEKLQDLVDKTAPSQENRKLAMCLTYTLKFEAFLVKDWSIYREVRSVTRPIDEEGENYETFRVYLMGCLWACLGAAMDTFFATRFPAITLDSGSILIMLVYSGKLFSRLRTLYIPFFGGRKFYINRRTPWTFKEQMLATLAMDVGVGSPYALRAIISQSNPHFLGIQGARSFGYMIMLISSSHFMGFGIAGMMRTFLVYPTRCIWYNVLPTIAVNRALVEREHRESTNGWRLKGAEFFGLIILISFVWYWVTNYLFQTLSYFDWPAWIAERNVHLQAITGCLTGLAFNPINTFDWNNIGAHAVVTPLFAQSMRFTGMLMSMLALIVIWYTNTTWTAYLPINVTELYANDGTTYQVEKVLNPDTNKLDEEKYQKYSLPFLSAGNLVNEGSYMIMYTGMIVYSILNYSKPIWYCLKLFCSNFFDSWRHSGDSGSLKSFNDRFSRAQRKYKEVPEWWFIAVMLASSGVAIAMVEYFTFTECPVWTIFFAIGISTMFCVPFGYLHSTTSINFEIATLFEMAIGLAVPGNANALMVSKVYAGNFFSQSASFITNQVQAHYTGIAPRALFRAQSASVAVSVFVKALLSYWVVSPSGIPDLCDPQNANKFTCQTQRTFFNSAIQWGTIGPRRMMGSFYPLLKYCFLAGTIYPVPFWLARRYIPRFTKKLDWLLHNVHEMALVAGIEWAPKSMQFVLGVTYVNILFNWYIKTRYPRWWQKYTYTFGHAMDVGVGYAGLIVFFSTEYKNVVNLDWWGNNQYLQVGDAQGMPLLPVPERGYFGPEKGHFP